MIIILVDKLFVQWESQIRSYAIGQPLSNEPRIPILTLWTNNFFCKTRGIKRKPRIEDRKMPSKSENDVKRGNKCLEYQQKLLSSRL